MRGAWRDVSDSPGIAHRDGAMIMAAQHTFDFRVVLDDRAKRRRIDQAQLVHAIDADQERRVVNNYHGRLAAAGRERVT